MQSSLSYVQIGRFMMHKETQNSNDTSPSIGMVIGILCLASSVSIMSTDMYAPSLPDLTEEFSTTPTRMKLTISLNMLAYGLAQLVHGPLSDRYGRRPVLLVSLGCVVIGCGLCVAAQTINQLILARVFLGLVAAAEAVIGLAVIKDLFTEKQQMKALALFGMVFAMVPAIAPIVGGYLHVAFGWQSNFYVIAAMAVIAALVVYRWLPESTTPDRDALQLQRILSAYSSLLKNADFVAHTLLLGVCLGLIFVFVTAAPFVLITFRGVPVQQFGFYQAAIVVSFFIGSLTASRLVDYWSGSYVLGFGFVLILLGSFSLIGIIVFDSLSAINLTMAYSIMTFGMGPVFAVAPSHALRSVNERAGSASALLSGLEQSTAALSGVAVSVLHDGTARPMAAVTVFLTLIMLSIGLWIRRHKPAQ